MAPEAQGSASGTRESALSRDPAACPSLGFGLGLRVPYFEEILQTRPAVDWFEVISENFMVAGGKPRYYLHAIRSHYPMVMHGVSLNIGGTDALDRDYLRALRRLARDLEPAWISDHLCWTAAGGVNSHDLMPLPCTEGALRHVVDRVAQVQDFLGCRMLLENASTYIEYTESEMRESEFLAEVARRADCLILLDINNVYVNSRNHGIDPLRFLDDLPAERIRQYHLAGGTDYGDYVIDTHDHAVPDPVWTLYAEALRRFGEVSTMIERDAEYPPLAELLAELEQARSSAARATAELPG